MSTIEQSSLYTDLTVEESSQVVGGSLSFSLAEFAAAYVGYATLGGLGFTPGAQFAALNKTLLVSAAPPVAGPISIVPNPFSGISDAALATN